uniref:Uncharacterized protein n=1 Tax=Pipistrellus kuhlii TaxID=59472 RepID=A0A7J8A7H4_PIPKU|nr:hypothetical protein mPipKuh1_008889 [Pipistrellus kuhlii]
MYMKIFFLSESGVCCGTQNQVPTNPQYLKIVKDPDPDSASPTPIGGDTDPDSPILVKLCWAEGAASGLQAWHQVGGAASGLPSSPTGLGAQPQVHSAPSGPLDQHWVGGTFPGAREWGTA